jgi:hypothetical protein
MKPWVKITLYWLKGLVAAFIGGAANAVTATIVAPESFNFNEGLGKVFQLSLVSGLVSAALYLKKSPVPDKDCLEEKNNADKN